jgi:hypothetical protein
VLKGIFEPKQDQVMGGSRKLHNEEHHSLYSSPYIIQAIKSWMSIAHMGNEKLIKKFWLESLKGRQPLKNLSKHRYIQEDNIRE